MSAGPIPRTLVRLSLTGIRLPISIAQHLGERSGIDIGGFPAVSAYDSVEAQAKQVLGRIIHDDLLVDEGERQAAAARRRSGAEWLSSEAEEIRDEADTRLEERVGQAEESREEAERRLAERQALIRLEEEEARKEAQARARRKEAAARRAARAREKAVEAKERKAELARIQAESEALEKESRAVEGEKVVTAIDEHLENRKAARHSNGS